MSAEYQNLELNVAIALVERAKQAARPAQAVYANTFPPTPTIPQQPPSYQYQGQSSPTPTSTAYTAAQPLSMQSRAAQDYQSSNLQGANNQSLQQILNSLANTSQTPNTTMPQQPAAPPPPYAQAPPQQQPQANPSAPPDISKILNAMQRRPNGDAIASNSQAQAAPQTSGPPDMAQIMAQLNRYGK